MADPYSYSLPENLIARRPSSPRDAARLFVYDTAHDEIAFGTFARLGGYLPPHALLVFNDTKVIPARAELKKETGGKVEILFLVNEWDKKGPIPALADRKLTIGAPLRFPDDKSGTASFTVERHDERIFYLSPHFPAAKLFALLEKKGITPLPKYIKGSGLREAALRKEYQAVFGAKPASVAAPTASLHFTNRLLAHLKKTGFGNAFLTLHVGLGTFAPVTDENIKEGTLHRETFAIPAATRAAIAAAKRAKRPIVAVGTTVVRALESDASGIEGDTKIFIRPPYRFRTVDALITNFHLPGTSLMMLVQAFLKDKGAKRSVTDLYKIAIQERFRFYSFGDGMLIL